MQRRLRTISRLVRRLIILVIVSGLAFAIAVAAVLLHWRLNGEQVLGVQTGSMQPLIKPGDAVIVRPATTTGRAAYHVGDIVAYRSLAANGLVITHRIVAVDHKTGWLTTKGDALRTADPTIPPRLVVGRAQAVAPGLGRLLKLARQPLAMVGLVYVPALWLIASECRRLYEHFADQLYRYHGVRPLPLGSKRATSGRL